MQLTDHFTLAEFVRSATATDRGIDNQLPPTLIPQAVATAQMLERIRAHLTRLAGRDIPIAVSSGYRCTALNRAVGSRDSSDHLRAQAADWTAPAFGSPYQLCRALAPQISLLGIGQLVHEFGIWVHTSTRIPAAPVNRVITISKAGTLLGIQEV